MDGSSQGSEPRRFGGRASIHVRDRLPGRQPGGPGGVHLVVAGRVLQALCRRRNAANRVAPGGRPDPDCLGVVGLRPQPRRGRDTLGAILRAGRGRLPAVQLSAAQRGRDGPQGPPLAGGPEEAVGSDRPGDRRRGAVGRPRDVPLRAVEPRLRRAAREVQGRVPEGARGRALAAVLVGPLQPHQRPAGRAPEAAAALDRPAGRRGGGSDRPRGPQ